MCDEMQLRLLGLGDGGLPKTRPVYRHIAQAIERGITTGALALDFRLPAERELAEALKVSRTTIVRCVRKTPDDCSSPQRGQRAEVS